MADADPRDLSGGERQRLALAIVLAGRDTGGGELPGALLLDEPTRGMDRAARPSSQSSARELAERGAAVMIATHDVEFAATFADRVILLARGEVAADGPRRGAALRGPVLLERGRPDPRRGRDHRRRRGSRPCASRRRDAAGREERTAMSWEPAAMLDRSA